MSTNTKIEWCEHTDNLWHGCTKVHAGCDHCYAETLSNRLGRDIWGPDKPRMIVQSVWADLDKQQKTAAAAGELHRVFVGSMMDIFEKPMPVINSKGELMRYQANIHHHDLFNRPMPTQVITDEMHTGFLRQLLFNNIDAKKYENLIFLFLTKRPSNIPKYIPPKWMNDPPQNVMFGISISDQETANVLIPQLLKVKGKKFLSIEPLLAPVEIDGFDHPPIKEIDWVIVGGESGHHARPMHPDWVRNIRNACWNAQVPFFFKQWGEWAPFHSLDRNPVQFGTFNDNLDPKYKPGAFVQNWISWDAGHVMGKFSKRENGRDLDGYEHSGFPWELFKYPIYSMIIGKK